MNECSSGDDWRKEVARYAYELWEKRGRPFGSPEVDWFRAEEELRLWRTPHSLPFSSMSMGHTTQ
jgi:hypothetical protein